MKKVVYTVILLALSTALLLCFAGCNKASDTPTTGSAGTTEQTLPEDGTVPTGPANGAGVGERDDSEDDAPPPETAEPKPSTEPSTEPTTEPSTEPSTAPVDPPEENSDPANITYSQFTAMSPEEQEAFIDSFPSLRDYINWFNTAKAKEADQDKVILDGNEIDLGKLLP